MGDWYIVIKTIKGRRYRYRQRTWREGARVRTQSFSLGPVDSVATAAPAPKPAPPPISQARALINQHLDKVFSELSDFREVPTPWHLPWDAPESPKGKVRSDPKIEALIKASGVKLGRHVDKAFYRPREDRISMPPRKLFHDQQGYSATESYYHTLLHELAHWTGHRSRLDRFVRLGDLRGSGYAREELVAEATAVIVMRALGYPREDLRAANAYFRVWLSRTDDQEASCVFAKREAAEAAELILGFIVNTTNQDVV